MFHIFKIVSFIEEKNTIIGKYIKKFYKITLKLFWPESFMLE